MLNILIRYDYAPSQELIQIFLDNLIHESVHIRKTAAVGLRKILFLNRSKKQLVQVDLNSESFQLIQSDLLTSEEVFQKTILHDKTYAGYSGMSYHVSKPVASPSLANQFIASRFRDEQFLGNFFYLLF